jgi:hypothetical protein
MRKDEKLLRATAKDWGVDPKAEMFILTTFQGGCLCGTRCRNDFETLGKIKSRNLRSRICGTYGS